MRGHKLLLFIISPILGLVSSIASGRSKEFRSSLFWFTIIYGSLFHISFLGDGASHWNRLNSEYLEMNLETFWSEIAAIVSFSPNIGYPDVYIHTLNYLVGSVLGLPRYYFFFVSIVYAFFYSRSVEKIRDSINWENKSNKGLMYFFFIVLLVHPSLPDIQFIRSSTGFWVLIYAALSFIDTKKKKYLLLMFFPLVFHVGYWVLAIPVWFVLLSRYRNVNFYFLLYMAIFIGSSTIGSKALQKIAESSQVGASKVEGYNTLGELESLRAEKLNEANSRNNFYRIAQNMRLQNDIFAYLLVFLFLLTRNLELNDREKYLLCFALLSGTIANLFSANFAIHNRSWILGGFFTLYFLVLLLSRLDLNLLRLKGYILRKGLTIFGVMLVPYVLYFSSIYLTFTSVYVFLFPPLNWFYYEGYLSVRQLVGMLL